MSKIWNYISNIQKIFRTKILTGESQTAEIIIPEVKSPKRKPKVQMRSKVIEEIVEMEKSYVKCLNDIIEVSLSQLNMAQQDIRSHMGTNLIEFLISYHDFTLLVIGH